jgi:hypothetical protein
MSDSTITALLFPVCDRSPRFVQPDWHAKNAYIREGCTHLKAHTRWREVFSIDHALA